MGFLRVLLGSALWASWALPLYTPCVLRGALRFFLMKFLLTYQKKHGIKAKVLSSNHVFVIHLLFQLNILRVGPHLLKGDLSQLVRGIVRILLK
jgi:hypothetical protein